MLIELYKKAFFAKKKALGIAAPLLLISQDTFCPAGIGTLSHTA